MNTLLQTITPINSMINEYIKAGFALIPITSGKGPTHTGWNKQENCVNTIEQINPNVGYGLAHAYSGTCALDVDNFEYATKLLADMNIDLSALVSASDSVCIDSGNHGHAKLLFRLPFGLTLPSKKINYNGTTAYELRCATTNELTVQDVLPSALNHPLTGKPYRWAGNGHFSKIPTIPMELLSLWQSLIEKDTIKNINIGTKHDVSLEDIKTAINCIPADCSREEWLSIGMALHSLNDDNALTIWNDWSATATTKYKGVQDILTCWKSFKERDDGIKIATLFHIANEHGYTRPTPDITGLFADITPSKPMSIIDGLRIPVPVMDIDLFPPILATRARELAYQIGCDPLVPLMAGLGAVCAAIDARSRLELMPGYRVPPILWLMTIGAPADKKTPASKPLMQILGQLEREDTKRYKADLMQWEAQEAMYASSKKSYLDAAKSPELMIGGGNINVADLPEVASEPPTKPVPLRLTVTDITSQKLVHHCADRPQGLLCYLDEMNSWVHKISDPRSGEDRSCWTSSYEGNKYTMDRVGVGSIVADPMNVSIYGNIQPKVLKANIEALSIDGLIQRFIPVILSGEYDAVPNYVPEMLTNNAQWETLIRVIHALPPTIFTLSPSAYEVFREFQHWYHQAKQDERILQSDDNYMTAFGKLEGTMARVLLILHIISDPYSGQVSVETCKNAIAIAKQYIAPALRYSFLTLIDIDKSLNNWCLGHIVSIAGDQDTITLREIKRSARRQLESKPEHLRDNFMLEAMGVLESEGWLVCIDSNKKSTTWAINPTIKTIDVQYRTNIILAKQRLLDNIRASSIANGKPCIRRFAKGFTPGMDNLL